MPRGDGVCHSMNLRAPFMETDRRKVLDFIRALRFATFISAGEDGVPVASHLPVDLVQGEGEYGTLVTHLALANPQSGLIAPHKPLLVIFTGEDAYISPSCFTNRSSAPTQAQAVVHCYGYPRKLTSVEDVRRIMEYQVNSREQGSWTTAELGSEGYLRRLKSICAIEMPIERTLASFRLLQDESKANVQCAVDALKREGKGKMAQCIADANR